MDILFTDVTVVTMDKFFSVLSHANVGVKDGKIAYIGRTRPDGPVSRVIHAPGLVLMPGLINAHTHLPMTLLRGFADDSTLEHWLFDHIFPAEERMDNRAIRAGTDLALAECIASGTVSVSDMYDHCDVIAACVDTAGLKANLSRGVTCHTGAFDKTTHEGYRETVALLDRWHGHDNGRIVAEVSIHGEYTSPPALWASFADLARDRGVGMHVHLSETRAEQDGCQARHGMTPTATLVRHGVFDGRTTAAHGVCLTDDDIRLLADRQVSLVHCPVSNLKLASGTARLSDWMAQGLNVALGTDGAASNNTLDMWEEIKFTGLLAKNAGGAPERFTAPQALTMAVTGGARAQGRAHETGQIAVGYDADLILLDFNRPHLLPCHNVTSHLAYAVRGGDVTMTMVRGRVLYENGQFLTIDMERVRYELDNYAVPKVTTP